MTKGRAVSPVVGVILLVAITIVLSATIGTVIVMLNPKVAVTAAVGALCLLTVFVLSARRAAA